MPVNRPSGRAACGERAHAHEEAVVAELDKILGTSSVRNAYLPSAGPVIVPAT